MVAELNKKINKWNKFKKNLLVLLSKNVFKSHVNSNNFWENNSTVAL